MPNEKNRKSAALFTILAQESAFDLNSATTLFNILVSAAKE